jgi:tocopherol O-methyltransferase
MSFNAVDKIQEHYDIASPYYQKLWGNHLHHGYYETGRESKEEAAEKLIELLAERSRLSYGSRVLDVGCGMGGSAIWLAENLGCEVTGISISPIQIRMATEASRGMRNRPTFVVEDANQLSVKGSFDIVWVVEALSHLSERGDFFRKAAELLVAGGKICEAAWLKDDCLREEDEEKYIRPIEKGMLVSLPDLSEYKRHIDDNGLRLLHYEDISAKVAATWDLCLGMIKDKTVWQLASRHGKEFTAFLKSFKAMRAGFRSGRFRYALMVIEKP